MAKRYRSNSGLVAWLSESERPILAFDARGRIRFVNQGMERLTGCHPEDLLGKSFDFRADQAGALSERIIKAFSPPPQVFNGEEIATSAHFIDSRGRNQSQELLFLPFKSDSSEELKTVLAIGMTATPERTSTRTTASQQFHAELNRLIAQQDQIWRKELVVAKSQPMQRLLRQLELARKSRTPVHFFGPKGSGKKYLAHRLAQVPGSERIPLATIDCPLLDRADLKRILNDLLGFARETETESNILLNGLPAIPLDLQETICELYESEEWPERCRLITTSEQSPDDCRGRGQLIDRIYYRISSFVIAVPGLHERMDDLDLLIQAFLEMDNTQRDIQLSGVDRNVRRAFHEYSWPGQVRELRETLNEASEICSGSIITSEHLPLRFLSGQNADGLLPVVKDQFRPLEESLEELERTEIERALRVAKGNKAKAAEWLGLTRAKFYRRLEALNFEL